MAIYRCTLRQAIGGGTSPDAYKWSNVWYIDAADVAAAASQMATVWEDILRTTCSVMVYAYEVYASDLLPESVDFTTLAIAPAVQRGTSSGPTGDGTDLYNPNIVLRIDLGVAGGYASRKWVRVGLNEVAVAPGGLIMSNTTWQAGIIAAYDDVTEVSGMVDESGNPFTGASLIGLRVKRLGKFARFELPIPPAFG